MIDEFPLISRTLSNVLNSHAEHLSALHYVPHFMDTSWLLLVPVETEVDLQLLETRFVVIHLAINR